MNLGVKLDRVIDLLQKVLERMPDRPTSVSPIAGSVSVSGGKKRGRPPKAKT